MKRTKLISARIAAGLSQQELADKCGVTRWTINRVELGERDPSVSLIQRIGEATNGAVTPSDFFPSCGQSDEPMEAAQ